MKRLRLTFITSLLTVISACHVTLNKDNESNSVIRIAPIITKVSEASFESGDEIGLSIVRASGAYATNERLSFDGTAFSGSLNWYDGSDAATLKAYYPYTSTFPTSFTVATNQSAGISSSDFVSSVKSNVYPTANAVSMVFQHRLVRLSISIVNRTDKTISGVFIKGVKPKALITDELTATVDNSSSAVTISAYKDGENYYVILPPQKVAMTAAVTTGGKEMTDQLAEATLVAGNQYNVTIVVAEDQIKVLLSGEVNNWNPGGELPGGDNPPVTTNTIYYGFGNSAQYVYENGLKKENATSAMGRYKATNTSNEIYYFNILIPASMTQPEEFTMGGAPVGFDKYNVTISGKNFIHYRTYDQYESDVELSILAQA